MTKVNPNKVLEMFIDTNTLYIRVEGWVKGSRRYGNLGSNPGRT